METRTRWTTRLNRTFQLIHIWQKEDCLKWTDHHGGQKDERTVPVPIQDWQQ